MNSQFEMLRRNACQTQVVANDAQRALEEAEAQCNHQWGDVTPDHIYEDGYTIPGDPPGTMGVDWRPACHVQPKTTFRWKRVCRVCGKEEHTSRTKELVTHTPEF